MTNLKDIVTEIENFGKIYNNSNNKEARKVYDQYINLIITNDAEKSQQYDLCDYWARLKYGN